MNPNPIKHLECLAYIEENAPSQEVMERFGEALSAWEIKYPLYCKDSDTISGITPLMFTLAIAHDISDDCMGGFEERYCFEDGYLAIEELVAWHKRKYNAMRPQGWVAVRKISSWSAFRESFEQYYSPIYAQELIKYADSPDSGEMLLSGNIVRAYEKINEEFGYSQNTVKHLAAYLKYTDQII